MIGKWQNIGRNARIKLNSIIIIILIFHQDSRQFIEMNLLLHVGIFSNYRILELLQVIIYLEIMSFNNFVLLYNIPIKCH